jgi:ABC-type transporter Mla maintaining outer membrane lipid asymmetry ATPase subunit MlaF
MPSFLHSLSPFPQSLPWHTSAPRGTGKSFLVKNLIKSLKRKHGQIPVLSWLVCVRDKCYLRDQCPMLY